MITMMADVATRPAGTNTLLSAIAATREHFNKHFDRGWLAMTIDDLPVDFATLRQIRELLRVREIYPEDIDSLRHGARQLRMFAADLRRFLLPVLKERLGVSGLLPARPRMEPSERVHRQLLYLSFPHNLTRLEELAEDLLAILPTLYDEAAG
jgi:hypothetical protein